MSTDTNGRAPDSALAAALTKLGDPAENLAGCLDALTELMGDEWVFHLIGRIRDHRGPGTAGTIRARLARRMVDQEMRTNGQNEIEAIRTVGERLGYTRATRGPQGTWATVRGNSLPNFAKLVRGTTRTGRDIGDDA